MKAVDSFQKSEIDRKSVEKYGYQPGILMENAGIRLVEAVQDEYGLVPSVKILFVAGSGNNGGDALVMARQIWLRHHKNLEILILKEEGSPLFKSNLLLCRRLGIPVWLNSSRPEALVPDADIIIDGISGTGLKGALRGAACDLALEINSRRKAGSAAVSIDVPSGAGDGYREGWPAVKADLTLTIGLPLLCLYKPHARDFCGRIRLVEIGFPPALKEEADSCFRIADSSWIEKLMPSFALSVHKYRRGHCAVLAGSKGAAGAAVLCAQAADRTAAGLVRLFADSDVFQAAASFLRGAMVQPLAGFSPKGFDAVAAGPGWGTEGRLPVLEAVLEDSRGVLDADALNLLAGESASGDLPDLGGRWVLTPHPGEFRRLFPQLDPAEPAESAPKAAKEVNAVVVLKQHVTYIASPDGSCVIVDGADPAMATGGSGDILTGLIAGYMSAGLEPADAALLGVLLHLEAGKRCGEKKRWYSAEDLVEYL